MPTFGAVGDQSATLPVLAAGASQTVTLSGLPAGAAGPKTLRAFIDSACQTVESDETNNQDTKFGFNIVTSISPARGGTVSCTPNPVAPEGTSTCISSVSPGYVFAGWRGDCAGQAGTTCALKNIKSAKAVVATYAEMALVVPSRGGWRALLGR